MTDGGPALPPPAWPPPNAPTVFVPGLPSPAYVVSRARTSAVVLVVLLPVLFTTAYARLFRNGLPISRLINPGVIGTVIVATVVLAVLLGPRAGQPTVVAGADWIAGRGLFSRRWRMVPLAHADRYSRRDVRSRSRTNTLVSIVGPAGQLVTLTFPAGDPALDEVLAALRATGAQLQPKTGNGWRVAVVATVLVLLFALPVVYFEIGPLRLLPRPIAGEFTWSGCRASLAAETDRPSSTTTFLVNPIVADGVPWRLQFEQRLDATTFAQRTENPQDRLTHLQRNGFLEADQAYLVDPQGHVMLFEALRFASPAGALAYDHYVNRAVCEHEYGAHGPRPTEVRLFRGSGALARWVAGSSIDEVTRTSSRLSANKAQIYAVAAALPR